MKKIKTNTATFFKDENDIVHVVVHEGIHLDYYDALDHYLVIKDLSGAQPVLKLIDSRASWTIQTKARKFLAGKDVKEKTIARAIVQSSSVKKVLVNFFTELNRPEVPTRMFTDYDEAYAWLLEIKKSGRL